MSATDRLPVIPIDNLVPCFGFCCCFHSLLTSNYCSGCYGRITLPCILIEQSICRPLENDSVYCCTCSKSECLLGYTRVCCQLESQCCCWDWRCSMPQREDHPCILTICFINCCYKFKYSCTCCETVRNLENYYSPANLTAPINTRHPVSVNPTAPSAPQEAEVYHTAEAFPVNTNVVADARIDR